MPVEYNPFDDNRLADIRAEQGDAIVQYYIVRTDLNMSAGKIGAQIAHGAQMFILSYNRSYTHWSVTGITPYTLRLSNLLLTKEWLEGSFRKVVLGGKKKDFEKIKNELNVFLVRDAGLTEVEPNSETVLTTWPMKKSEQPKVLSRLQVLK
jgi:PTH2 family peptidyl-tRNA hydrolase